VPNSLSSTMAVTARIAAHVARSVSASSTSLVALLALVCLLLAAALRKKYVANQTRLTPKQRQNDPKLAPRRIRIPELIWFGSNAPVGFKEKGLPSFNRVQSCGLFALFRVIESTKSASGPGSNGTASRTRLRLGPKAACWDPRLVLPWIGFEPGLLGA
jgi:hypothetical protein